MPLPLSIIVTEISSNELVLDFARRIVGYIHNTCNEVKFLFILLTANFFICIHSKQNSMHMEQMFYSLYWIGLALTPLASTEATVKMHK